MAEKPASLAELTDQLGIKVKEKKMAVVKTEAKHYATVEDYLVALENLLQGELDGKALRYWIDSSALVLGKNLAKESLATEEGKNVADGIDEIVSTEEEIIENNEWLQKTAEAAGMTVDDMLGDEENEMAEAVRSLRAQKEARIIELRTALQSYAQQLVRTLREGNRRKLGMTTDELAVWEAKFAAIDVLPQDEKSYTERLQKEFLAIRLRGAKVRCDRVKEFHNPFKDAKYTGLERRMESQSETVWGEYAQYIVDVLIKELPGDENEEKRRHILAGLLRTDGDGLLRRVDNNKKGLNHFVIKNELINTLSVEAVYGIARQEAIAYMLSSLSLESKGTNLNVFDQCIKMLNALDREWLHKTSQVKTFVVADTKTDLSSEEQRKESESVEERKSKEIILANEVNAILQFLYDGLTENEGYYVTNNIRKFQELSPVLQRRWVGDYLGPYTPSIPASITPDGILYSRMDAPAQTRVTMQQATDQARSFLQRLSDSLNKDKRLGERVPVTPFEVTTRNEGIILSAEQQALEAMNEAAEMKKALAALEKKAASEKADMQREYEGKIQKAESRLNDALRETNETKKVLTGVQTRSEESYEGYKKEKEELRRVIQSTELELEDAKRKATEAASTTESLLEQLREAIEKPAGFLGGGLKKVIEAILEKAESKK
ncbi:hypothetical protein HYV73_00050 [Candidatus Uhrbacteria bacterium]|nr:hypothetical protein [Candidatus Uhrbacteria bacterium]